jgi:hypothetical protein
MLEAADAGGIGCGPRGEFGLDPRAEASFV